MRQIPECHAQWAPELKFSKLVPVPWFFPELSKAFHLTAKHDQTPAGSITRELCCCGTASPCGAGIALRRKLLLQRQKPHFIALLTAVMAL
jgi:hypothetical protein